MSNILVVDDMAIFREPIALALRHAGFVTDTAVNGLEALQKARTARPDLILLDMAMPEMDGLEFLRHRSTDAALSEVPVILLTAVADRASILRAGQLGVRDYMLKSRFSVKELLVRVRRRLTVEPEFLSDPVAAAGAAHPTPEGADSPAPASLSGGRPEGEPPAPAPPTRAGSADTSSSFLRVVDALRQLKPLLTRTQLLERVEHGTELKALSPTVAQLLEQTGNPNCSANQIVRVIRQDHALSLMILKLANSVVYTRGTPVESVQNAVTRIGVEQIRQAALNISVIDAFGRNGSIGALAIAPFWEHSIACGLFAAEIVHTRGGTIAEADGAFTIGLLHDVGRVILAQQLGEVYDRTMTAARDLQLPLEQVESRMLSLNHADIMERLLTGWHFPRELVTPITLHHLSLANIRQTAPASLDQAATLALANRLAHDLLLGDSGNPAIYPTADLSQSLKLSAAQVRATLAKVPPQVQDIKTALLARSAKAAWTPLKTTIRSQLELPLRPIFIGPCSDIDGLALFTEQLAQPSDSSTPNVAVIHLTDVSQRLELSAALRTAESRAGAGPMPILMISPNGTLRLEDAVTAGRRIELLNCPFHVGRFISAVRRLLAA